MPPEVRNSEGESSTVGKATPRRIKVCTGASRTANSKSQMNPASSCDPKDVTGASVPSSSTMVVKMCIGVALDEPV